MQLTNSYNLACKGINITTTTWQSLNHATHNQAVHHATLKSTEVTIYQETIQLAQIKFFRQRTYNIDKYCIYFNDFLWEQKIINLQPRA